MPQLHKHFYVGCKLVRHFLIIILTFLVVTIFSDCRNGNTAAKNVEQQALKISNLDSNELLLFHNFSYGIRGDNDFWMRISGDTSLYACTYKSKKDTTEITVFRPYNFKNDFACSFTFDTSKYHEFKFSLYKSKIVRISLNDTAGRDYFIDTSLLVSQLFPSQNPFQTFGKLTALKDNLGFIGTKYNSNIGDLTIFWLTPQYKLTHLVDPAKLNPPAKKYWLDDFEAGKKIKEHWSLQKAYE